MRVLFNYSLATAIVVFAFGLLPCRAQDDTGTEAAIGLLELMLDLNPDAAIGPIDAIRTKLDESTFDDVRIASLRQRLSPMLKPLIKASESSLNQSAVLLAGRLSIPEAMAPLRQLALSPSCPIDQRAKCIGVLRHFGQAQLDALVTELLRDDPLPDAIFEAIVDAIAQSNDASVGSRLLQLYPHVSVRAQPRIIDVLSGRIDAARALLEAIENESMPKNVISANQAARILALGNADLSEKLTAVWGSVRTERDPQRLGIIAKIETLIRSSKGDPHRGANVFSRVCAQCHKLHGEGHDVGPEVTRNGRGSFQQLLSNVLDPNLVIGAGFISRTILTLDGRVVTGLVIEETTDRVVLKIQGGRTESILRDDIDTEKKTGLSLMPEGLESQMKTQELVDLFALLTLELPPGHENNRIIPGTPESLHR